MLPEIASNEIKKIAKDLGFQDCKIAASGFLEEEAPLLEAWLNKNMHGKMEYMQNHFDKRLNPSLLVDNAKSVITLSYNYFPQKKQNPNSVKISKYAYGEDYHIVVKDKLYEMLLKMQEKIGEFNARVFVDSAPVLEKAWAKKSGLGWQGKNANIISKKEGSFFFLAEIICDITFQYDLPVKDYCGSCTRCIDACPTDAIIKPYVVDGSKCISYLTIELKENIPNEWHAKLENWMFGCDICQDVCPWNRFSKPTNEDRFTILPSIENFTTKEWEEITEELFKKLFKNSPLKRRKYLGIKNNILSATSTKEEK